MSYIEIFDYLLMIPYIIGFYILARILFRKEDKSLRGFYFTAFWLRILGCILYSMVMQYYYGYGDSFTFFKGSNFFTDRIREDISNIRYLYAPIEDIAAFYNNYSDSDPLFAGYFGHPSGNMVMKISAVLSFFSFHRFLIVSLFFAFFSFYGQWKLFTVFDHYTARPFRKVAGLLILVSPSIWFWGSGLMKDSLCLGSLGLITYLLFRIYKYRKVKISYLLALFLLGYVVFTVKSYILVIFIIAIVLTWIFMQIRNIQNFAMRMITSVALFFTGLIAFLLLDLSAQIDNAVTKAVSQIVIYQNDYLAVTENVESSKGGFSISEIEPTLGGILSHAPQAIFNCLFRPLIWESRSVMIFFTSLESTALLCFVIYLLLRFPVGFFKEIFTNYFFFFCFVLSMFFALLIGFTTFNFGTMIRYKIIFLPFFYFLIINLYARYRGVENVVTTVK